MDTDTLFIPLGDIFINTMEAEGELCELAGTEGHCSSRGSWRKRERNENIKKVKDQPDLIRDRKHETDFEGGNGVGVAILHQV